MHPLARAAVPAAEPAARSSDNAANPCAAVKRFDDAVDPHCSPAAAAAVLRPAPQSAYWAEALIIARHFPISAATNFLCSAELTRLSVTTTAPRAFWRLMEPASFSAQGGFDLVEHALELCCDAKSQMQALDRTQPGLPLKKGRAQTMTHDYKRLGTTTLVAALNVLDGQVTGQCQQRPTHADWLKFLRQIDRETPKDKTLHLIADNYATHNYPAVYQWLAKHPRFNMNLTPTSASWLNIVERFFRDIAVNRLRRGVFTSLPELVAAIDEYVTRPNTNPKPFIWTKSACEILQKVIWANARLGSKQNAKLH